jgi:hypothetical protein
MTRFKWVVALAVCHCFVEGVVVGRVCRHRELCRAQESIHELPSLSWFDGDHPITWEVSLCFIAMLMCVR